MSFVPYQVDHTVKNISKTVGFSKKKITFKFGIANPQSIRDGLVGVACRGSEHEIVMTWSLYSGKRQLLVDGKESHHSVSGQNGWVSDRIWQHMFDIKVPGMGKFRAIFISQPIQREVPGSKAFDVRISGVSYFAFNQLYQLGTPQMVVRGSPRAQMYGNDEPMSPEERRQVAVARLESLRDLREKDERQRRMDELKSRESEASRASSSLIDLGAPPPATTLMNKSSSVPNMMINSGTAHVPYGQNPYPPPAHQAAQPPNAFGGPPPQQQGPGGYASPPAAGGANPYGQSSALAPYAPPAGQAAPSPYAIPSGMIASPGGAAPPQPPQQGPYGFASPGGGAPATPETTPSVYSYGSAPTFAQPPSQQPQQQMQQYAMQQQQQQQAAPSPQYNMQQPPHHQQQHIYGQPQPGVPSYNAPHQAYNVAPQF